MIVRQSLFQTNYGLGDEKRLIDPAKIVAESKYKDRTGQKLEDSVMNRAATISGRAIFIAGLAQNGNGVFLAQLILHPLLNLILCACCIGVISLK